MEVLLHSFGAELQRGRFFVFFVALLSFRPGAAGAGCRCRCVDATMGSASERVLMPLTCSGSFLGRRERADGG